MTDVFISYAREDRARVRPIADALAARGLIVWWDPELRAGRDFRTEIAEALGTAKAMIVAWSRYSTSSRFVRDEADEGAAREILFPILLDLVDIPLGFRQTHTLDLTSWPGDTSYPPCQALIEAIASFVASRPSAPAASAKPLAPPHSVSGILPFSITGVLARSRLLFRMIIMSCIAAAAAFLIWSFVALTSDNVDDECHRGLVGLLGCAHYWQQALVMASAALALTLLTRSLTFWADGVFGARSLNFFSRSFATTVLSAALLAAPFELELRFSSYALLRPFREVAFSADGSKIFARSRDGIVAWQVQGPDYRRPMEQFSEPDNPLRISSPLHSVGSVTIDGPIDVPPNVLNPPDCTPDALGHPCGVTSVSASADGTRIVTGSADGVARVWDKSGAETLTIPGHRNKIYLARFSPNGRLIVTTSADRTIAIWTARKGKLLHRFSLAIPVIGRQPADPVPLLQSVPRTEGVPRYDLKTLGVPAIILRGLCVFVLTVLSGTALKIGLERVIRPQFQQWMMLSVMTGVVLFIAWVYATNLPAEGLLFWFAYAALLTPIVALARVTLAALMRPAFARTE